MNELLDIFAKDLRHLQGLSDNTIKAYTSDVLDFLQRLVVEDVDELKQIQYDEIRDYLMLLHANSISRVSQCRKISALKSFFGFLRKNQIIETDPTAKVTVPKVDVHLPGVLNENEVTMLLDYAQETAARSQDYFDCRNTLLVELLYSTGMRVSELVKLTWGDVDLASRSIRVRDAKGGKDRVVLFNDHVLKALHSLVEKLHSTNTNTSVQSADVRQEPIFKNKHGGCLNVRTARQIVYDLARAAGLQNVHPHTFRHCAATHLLDGGADIRIVQELLGHSNLQTTQKYTHTSVGRLLEKYHSAFPR
ncbi:MAG: tyrosine-type recombinase/integrase [Candidatus Ancillula sp.]|nr:tyrosine-type recombinase/integrase [Candidatus Ancillula sp.]